MARIIKIVLAVLVLLGLLVTLSISFAQAPPDNVINPILADLSQRVGRTVTIDDLVNYSWTQRIFNNESLDCPSPDVTYTRSFVQGYIVRISYGGLFWDYRYDAGRNSFFLCNNPNLDFLVLPVTATPTLPPTATPLPATATLPPSPTFLPTQAIQPAQATVQSNAVQNQAAVPGASPVAGTTPCPQALTGGVASRLKVGDVGRFVGNATQNIHAEPNRTSTVMGVTRLGDTFSVVQGPACDRTFTWWQVDTAGVLGWVGEVNPSDLSYWLEPTGQVANVPQVNATEEVEDIAPVVQANAPEIAELSRQTVQTPTLLLANASPLNPEGIVVIMGGDGISIYSNTAPSAPLETLADHTVLEAVLSSDGSGMIVIEQPPTGQSGYGLGFYSTTGGGGNAGPLNADYMRGMVSLSSLNSLAIGGPNGVLLYDLASNQVVADLSLDITPLELAVSASSNRLAILLPDQLLLVDMNTRTEIGSIPMTASQNGATGLVFSADGSLIAVSDGAAGTATVYDLSNLQARFSLPVYSGTGGEVYHLAFSPDGQYIATAGNRPDGSSTSDTPQVQLWDATTGELVGMMGSVAGDQFITGLAFDPSSRLLNAISRQNLWQIWQLP